VLVASGRPLHKNGLVDQAVTSKEPLSDSGRLWYTNMHKLTANKEIKVWHGWSLVDLLVTVRWWKTPLLCLTGLYSYSGLWAMEQFTATSQICWITVQLVVAVSKDIFVWIVGPRHSVNYFILSVPSRNNLTYLVTCRLDAANVIQRRELLEAVRLFRGCPATLWCPSNGIYCCVSLGSWTRVYRK